MATVNATTEQYVTLVVTLSQEEARTLQAMMQNPEEDDTEIAINLRHSLFAELKKAGIK
ncbi:hypothetical protein FROZEN_46 [Erwinia phage vB_EamP_Frozen]|uniref:Uncharacterized protein n=2 Tax=Johnsonvirus frozen TaxID=1982578 RepID=A0A191ZD88_9CAUD|nr:hypothetical protein FROZEN_46 [Erwinia phage vB_EamP_Frozen]ANJ65176.1 hypothetical protein FROZEN_46 [Erwinia phage vB_EamP_Frozen]ANJ65352.1 hypothetical protein GUTMEISTER_38 [Erwinia phage vB_EamP_Gutmeister]